MTDFHHLRSLYSVVLVSFIFQLDSVQKACYSDISFVYCLGARPGIVKALEEFKLSVYGENYEEDDAKTDGKAEPSRKRKANAMKEYSNYDWSDLADNGKVTFSSL